MDRRTLSVLALVALVGCGSTPEAGGDDPATRDSPASVAWTPLPELRGLLEHPLDSLPQRYLGVSSGTVKVEQTQAKTLLLSAYPTLTRARLQAWRAEGWVKTFAIGAEDEPLSRAFFAPLDTSGSMWHKEHRVRVVVDDPRAVSLEFLMDSQRPVVDFELQVRGLLIEPRFSAEATFAEQLQQLGIDPSAYGIAAVHPELGAAYGAGDFPGQFLVSTVDGAHRVTAVFQGPLPAGFTPWDEVAKSVRVRQAKGQPMGPLEPWVRHAAFGELQALLGTPPVTREEHEALEQRLLSTLQSNVSPGQFLTSVRYAQAVERGLSLFPDAPEPLLPGFLPQLRDHAKAQRERAAGRGLPIVAATWGWLAWELRDPALEVPNDFGTALRNAVFPVFGGEVGYTPHVVADMPLGKRSGAGFSAATVKRDEGAVRWRVAYGDFDSIEGSPTESVDTKVTWKEPNPAYPKWEAEMEDLQDQIDMNMQSRPTIEVSTGRMLRNGQMETERVPDTNSTEHLRAEQLTSELDVLALDEPDLETTKEKTIQVAVQRYSGTVTRRYTIFAKDDRVVDRFDEVTEVSLGLRKHAAVPEAGLAALDEHMTLDEVSQAQARGVIERDLPGFYAGILQRVIRGELELRLAEGAQPTDAADELAWGQWWLGLEVDEDLRPALGAALELQANTDPVLEAPERGSVASEGSLLEGLLERAGEPRALPE